MASEAPPHPVRAAYLARVADGALAPDAAQDEANALLADIAARLEAEDKRSGLKRLFARRRHHAGAYVWGEVGRGKTMLMDLFMDNTRIAQRRRVHFHEFMDEVHREIAVFRVKSSDDKGRRDPIPFVTAPIIESTRLLCLDEFHVTDITNAMLLGRLFEALFAGGVTLVATSNSAPDDLYHNGLNRQLFLPFIALLKARTTVLELRAVTDYRHLKLAGQTVFAFGPPETTRPKMDAMWRHMTDNAAGAPGSVHSLGRDIAVPRQAGGVARFGFAQLCDAPLGARDYLRLAEQFEALIIDDVPGFTVHNANAAQRFILLVDTLYDRGIKLAAGFATPLAELNTNPRMDFPFARCLSRLAEMQSEDYLSAPVGLQRDAAK